MISHGHVRRTRPSHVVLPRAYKRSGLVILYPDLLKQVGCYVTASGVGQRAPDTHSPSYVAHIRAVAGLHVEQSTSRCSGMFQCLDYQRYLFILSFEHFFQARHTQNRMSRPRVKRIGSADEMLSYQHTVSPKLDD